MNLLPITIVNLLQISVTLCGQLQRGVCPEDILQRQPSQPYSDGDTTNKQTNKQTHTHTTNTSHPYKFSTILSVFHILTDIVNHIFQNLVFYNCTVAWLYF
jgi:hypothetical protein